MASLLMGRSRDSRGRGGGPLGSLVKGAAAGIGLVSESIHHYKENKAQKEVSQTTREISRSNSPNPPAYESLDSKIPTTFEKEIEKSDDRDEDEKEWALDEAQIELLDSHESAETPSERPKAYVPKKVVKIFIDAYPVPPGFKNASIPLPVVLPQRRPKDRTRGFIRAYAPELQNCGITEPMFLDFLDTFNKATLAAPWLDAINLASFAFMVLPTAIGQAASIALAIAVDITKNMQSRHRHSYILDQMNEDFYRPRGLYALVLTWNPEVNDASIGVNINETIGKNLVKPQGAMQKAVHSFRPSMGNTNGVVFAETAPLVFPVLDATLTASTHKEAKTNKEKLVLTKSLVADYFDRRAQAQYAGENPDSDLLVAPKPKFTSRYSDPNHPSNSGSLIGLLTGGKIVLPPAGQRITALANLRNPSGSGYGYNQGFGQGYNSNKQVMSGGRDQECYNPNQPQSEYSQQQGGYGLTQFANQRRAMMQSRNSSGGLIGATVGRVLRKHVLYLMIVNMPSDEELAQATQHLKEAEQELQREP